MKRLLRPEIIIVSLFLIAILLPGLDICLKLDRFRHLNENRAQAAFPVMVLSVNALQKFPQEYTRWFNDHFGFRNMLVRANFFIRHTLMGGSPSRQVIVGKDGWLFYNGEGTIEDFRCITKFDATSLAKWGQTLEKRRLWLERQGIRYIYMIAPNKSTVYGEFMPDAYTRVRASSGLDDMVEYLKKNTRVTVVDSRQAFLAAKSRQRLYLKTDTHWNQYGAFLAYSEIMKPLSAWFPSLRAKTLEDFTIETNKGNGGDLTALIGGTEFIKDDFPVLKPKDGSSLKLDGINDKAKSPLTVTRPDNRLPRAIFFRDSFFSSVAPFIANHFSYSCYYWDYWNSTTPIEEMIHTHQPDIVIEEVVERSAKFYMKDLVANTPKYLQQ